MSRMHLVDAYGGWRDRRLVDLFERSSRTVFERYRGLVNYWLTFNEINIMDAGVLYGGRGSSSSKGRNRYATVHTAVHHVLLRERPCGRGRVMNCALGEDRLHAQRRCLLSGHMTGR